MRQIEIDYEVFKTLAAMLQSEEDSYNDILRRVLGISDSIPPTGDPHDWLKPAAKSVLSGLLDDFKNGAFLGNVFFPNGTKFRATYKGKTFRAEITDELWVGEDGIVRQSPSEAAGAISGTKVNGWRFWYAKRLSDEEWRRLDELRK